MIVSTSMLLIVDSESHFASIILYFTFGYFIVAIEMWDSTFHKMVEVMHKAVYSVILIMHVVYQHINTIVENVILIFQ